MRGRAEPVTALTPGKLDGGKGGDVKGPEEAVVDEQRVFFEIVDGDEDEQSQGKGHAGGVACTPEGPEAAPGEEPAEEKEREAGEAEFEGDLEEAVVGVLDHEV